MLLVEEGVFDIELIKFSLKLARALVRVMCDGKDPILHETNIFERHYMCL